MKLSSWTQAAATVLAAFSMYSATPVDALNVAVVCTFGTRSDIAPIFEGLREFAVVPGNKVTYLASEGIPRTHASQFSYVDTHLMRDIELPAYFNNSIIPDIVQTKRRVDNTQLILAGINYIADIYEANTPVFIKYFRQHQFDLVMCDAVEQACMDAAKETGTKLAIYGPLGQFDVGGAWFVPDFLDPMPMEKWIASPWKRAKSYLDLIPFIVAMVQARFKIMAAQARLGLTVPYVEPWEYPQNHLMLAHHVLGIDAARAVPTNIEVFGPVVNVANIPPIEPELQVALDGYSAQGIEAIFIAFGSVFTLKDSPELYAKVLASIGQLLADESRPLAVIWASAFHDPAMVEPLQTQYPGRFLTPAWANQRRALMHDSVRLLLSAGGYGSMVEAMFNGKAQLILPLYFDQFLNAHNAEDAGFALQMDKYDVTSEEMTTKVRHLLTQARDANSTYARTLRKWQQVCEINNQRAGAIVTTAVTLAATVGVDHLIPRDVTLSVFDRFAIVEVAVTLLTLWWLRKFFFSRGKSSSSAHSSRQGRKKHA